MTPLGLYLLFAKIGFFTFGGGYAMIPLYQTELVGRLQLLSTAEFADMVALAQMTPGPVGLNAATYIGQQQCGFWGAVAGTLGVATPSLTLGILAAVFLKCFGQNPWLQRALKGIRPATLGLVASAVLFFAEASVFTGSLTRLGQPVAQGGTTLSLPGTAVFFVTILLATFCRRLKLTVIFLIAALLAIFLY